MHRFGAKGAGELHDTVAGAWGGAGGVGTAVYVREASAVLILATRSTPEAASIAQKMTYPAKGGVALSSGSEMRRLIDEPEPPLGLGRSRRRHRGDLPDGLTGAARTQQRPGLHRREVSRRCYDARALRTV